MSDQLQPVRRQRRCAVQLPAFATKDELHRLYILAVKRGLTVSELVRRCVEERYGPTFEGSEIHPNRTVVLGDEPIIFSVGGE